MSDRVVFITDEDLGLKPDTCPCCGQRVSVSTADEGTCSYVGEEYNAAIEDAAQMAETTESCENHTDYHHIGEGHEWLARKIRDLKKEDK